MQNHRIFQYTRKHNFLIALAPRVYRDYPAAGIAPARRP
jgi:hypothetical protein